MRTRTTVAPHYAIKNIIVGLLCLVFGIWGIYDHQVVIPSREQAHIRGDVAVAARDALVPGASAEEHKRGVEAVKDALIAFRSWHEEIPYYWRLQTRRDAPANQAVEGLVRELIEDARPPADDQELQLVARALPRSLPSFRLRDQAPWAVTLTTLEQALSLGRANENETLSGVQLYGYELADQTAQIVATIKKPSTFDRPTQWAFILCLPFAPYFFWIVFRLHRRVYALDEDGTLHLPGETWKKSEIRDIHMDKWMAKSIAYVEHVDGRRVKLDDYKHRNLHRIIGAIASERYPEKWEADAKPVKAAAGPAGQPSEGSNPQAPAEEDLPEASGPEEDMAADAAGSRRE